MDINNITQEQVKEKIIKIVAEQLGIEESEIKADSSFQEDLGADSLDSVELVMALEEAFGCEIPDEEAEQLTTVQKVVDYVFNNLENIKKNQN